MGDLHRIGRLAGAAVLAGLVLAVPARSAEPRAPSTWLMAVVAPLEGGNPEAPAWQKKCPMSFSLDYTLVSDYVWRGINFSEYRGEGREKLNHQLTVGAEFDPAQIGGPKIGRFGISFWFEWFAGQEALTPWSERNLQEVDYTAYWAYDWDAAGLGFEIGWSAYTFPRLRDSDSPVPGDLACTQEVYLKASFDDSKLFGKPMVTPTFAYYLDVDDVRASWIEVGISHDFALADCGLKNTPVLKDTVITPSLLLAIDHRMYDKLGLGGESDAVGTRLAYLQYGLNMAVDMSSALCLPPCFGSLTLKGFMYYTQSFHDSSADIQDEFWGGTALSWRW